MLAHGFAQQAAQFVNGCGVKGLGFAEVQDLTPVEAGLGVKADFAELFGWCHHGLNSLCCGRGRKKARQLLLRA